MTPGITPYVIGGLQRHSFNLTKYLARRGVQVDLYHTSFSEPQKIDALDGMSEQEKANIVSIAIPWESDRYIGHYLRALRKFSRNAFEIYKARPQVDCIIGKSLTAWEFVEAKRRGELLPPIGINFHGYEVFQQRPTARTKLEAAMLRPSFLRNASGADFVFSYGGKITKIIEEKMHIPTAKIIEIPGGIDPVMKLEAPPVTGKRRKFVFLGRYERRKGIDELNKAIAANPHWVDRCEFIFIGDIPPKCRLNFPNLSYLGEIRDPAEIQSRLATADILLCPSHSEGMPNVILEAMAAGLAILATDVGAVSLLVTPANGILLATSTPGGIANAIEIFLIMPTTTLNEMKAHSHDHVANFFWPEIVDRTITALSGVIAQSHENANA
jgi:glycosyltransferase involved in cell wall biosynthesis